ncbi:MAG: hypothetical protein GY818_01340 [Planctomycetaceae bacterium]|nr:hypothetical protein [Planctomycetaceae bacterium]
MATEIDPEDIVKGLEKVPDIMVRKSFEGVLRTAGNVMKKEWKDRLPRSETGNAKRSITTKVYPPTQSDPSYTALVYAKRPTGAHVHLLEGGWDVGKRGPTGQRQNQGLGVPVESGSPRVEGKGYLLKSKKVVTPKIEKVVADAIIKELDKVFK